MHKTAVASRSISTAQACRKIVAHAPTVITTTFGPDTIRKRRLRRRARDGKAVLKVEVNIDKLIDAMLESRRLSESDALDRRKVEADAALVLAEWAAQWLEK